MFMLMDNCYTEELLNKLDIKKQLATTTATYSNY